MQFRRELDISPFPEKMKLGDRVLLTGSCFTEHLGHKLQQNKFRTLQNPNGILFNPVSIGNSLTSYITNTRYAQPDIFFAREWWTSWDHHSRFSHVEPQALLDMINHAQEEAHGFLQSADWLVITLGSAFVYQLENGKTVANCHKMPASMFRKKLLHPEDVLSVLDNLVHRLFLFNSRLRIIFTISPVRHLRDGFVENNRSKAILIQAVHHLVEKFSSLHYFPAYELVIDDLRDYRFYAEDMVHPNYMATDYVWEKFAPACIDENALAVMKDINRLNAARAHKPFQPASAAHREFLRRHFELALSLQQQHPGLDWEADLAYFGGS